jgi:hypothetical protein
MTEKTPENLWYVRTKNGASGPYTSQQIKGFAANGKLPRNAHLSKSPDGPWTVAENAKGLFPELPKVEAEQEVQASDFVPDVVKNSASALSSAVAGMSKSRVSQVKKVESGLAARAEAAASSMNSLCAEGQDPAFVAKVSERVNEICIRDETILYIAVQSAPIPILTPDSVVLTNRRFIIFRPKLLGRMTFFDCLWRDCKNVHVEENVFGATLAFTGMNGHLETLDYIPKAQARMIYRHSQEQEELAFHTRRNMQIEELQARADKTVINQAIGVSPQQASPPGDDVVSRMEKLKGLMSNGLISAEEFEAKKQQILDSI